MGFCIVFVVLKNCLFPPVINKLIKYDEWPIWLMMVGRVCFEVVDHGSDLWNSFIKPHVSPVTVFVSTVSFLIPILALMIGLALYPDSKLDSFKRYIGYFTKDMLIEPFEKNGRALFYAVLESLP